MEIQLSEKWIIWYHHVSDTNWLEESYTKLFEIETLEDFWKINNTIRTYTSGMFFVMRENIFPRWEDINNIDGGYWTFRISKKDLDQIWTTLFATLVGNTLTKKIENMDMINGISISPKINNCIIKVWNNDYNKNDIELLNDQITGLVLGEAFYRKHQDQNDIKLSINNSITNTIDINGKGINCMNNIKVI